MAIWKDQSTAPAAPERVLTPAATPSPAAAPAPTPTSDAANAPVRPAAELSEMEQSIWDALEGGETQLDTIIARTGLPAASASSQLMRMELKRLVKQLPGRHYVRME